MDKLHSWNIEGIKESIEVETINLFWMIFEHAHKQDYLKEVKTDFDMAALMADSNPNFYIPLMKSHKDVLEDHGYKEAMEDYRAQRIKVITNLMDTQLH